MDGRKANTILRNHHGTALLETVPLVVIFVVLIRFGLGLFGVEAQRILRLEKGHIIVGQDTDGLTNVLEIGMAGNAAAKPFFVGSSALHAYAGRDLSRKLVGFSMDGNGPPPK